jgi:hypothetical protein
VPGCWGSVRASRYACASAAGWLRGPRAGPDWRAWRAVGWRCCVAGVGCVWGRTWTASLSWVGVAGRGSVGGLQVRVRLRAAGPDRRLLACGAPMEVGVGAGGRPWPMSRACCGVGVAWLGFRVRVRRRTPAGHVGRGARADPASALRRPGSIMGAVRPARGGGSLAYARRRLVGGRIGQFARVPGVGLGRLGVRGLRAARLRDFGLACGARCRGWLAAWFTGEGRADVCSAGGRRNPQFVCAGACRLSRRVPHGRGAARCLHVVAPELSGWVGSKRATSSDGGRLGGRRACAGVLVRSVGGFWVRVRLCAAGPLAGRVVHGRGRIGGCLAGGRVALVCGGGGRCVGRGRTWTMLLMGGVSGGSVGVSRFGCVCTRVGLVAHQRRPGRGLFWGRPRGGGPGGGRRLGGRLGRCWSCVGVPGRSGWEFPGSRAVAHRAAGWPGGLRVRTGPMPALRAAWPAGSPRRVLRPRAMVRAPRTSRARGGLCGWSALRPGGGSSVRVRRHGAPSPWARPGFGEAECQGHVGRGGPLRGGRVRTGRSPGRGMRLALGTGGRVAGIPPWFQRRRLGVAVAIAEGGRALGARAAGRPAPRLGRTAGPVPGLRTTPLHSAGGSRAHPGLSVPPEGFRRGGPEQRRGARGAGGTSAGSSAQSRRRPPAQGSRTTPLHPAGGAPAYPLSSGPSAARSRSYMRAFLGVENATGGWLSG